MVGGKFQEFVAARDAGLFAQIRRAHPNYFDDSPTPAFRAFGGQWLMLFQIGSAREHPWRGNWGTFVNYENNSIAGERQKTLQRRSFSGTVQRGGPNNPLHLDRVPGLATVTLTLRPQESQNYAV